MNTDSANQSVPDLSVGDTFESFQIVQQINTTSSSILWKGYDRLLDRHVAIKQLIVTDSDPDGEAIRGRFVREAFAMKSVAASSDQKHLVRVIDLIDQPRGLFIVMEYVEGPSLEQILAQVNGPLDKRQALGIVAAVAIGLAYIHRCGLIHQDLKPANILLPRAGGLKLVDFGLCTVLGDHEASSGSARYMAPELFSGTAEPSSDLYSLGMIAYEMLAGRPAFHEAFRAVLRDNRNQTLRWMKWHTNMRTKAAALQRVNLRVDSTVSELVARMMEKDPSRRIRSTDELIGAIRRHSSAMTDVAMQHGDVTLATTTTVSAAECGDIAPTAPLPRRKRLPIFISILLLLQLLTAGGVVGYFMLQKQAHKRQKLLVASKQFDEARNHFVAERYDDARLGFQALAQAWTHHHTYGRMATAYNVYCSAMIAWNNKQYIAALDLLDQVDAMQAFKDRDRIQEDRHHIDHDRGFALLLSEIRAHSDNNEHLDALAQIERNRHISLSTHDRRRLDELAELVRTRRTREQIGEIRVEVDGLMAEDKHQEAIDLVDRLQHRRNVTVEELGAMRRQIVAAQTFTQLRQQAQAELARPLANLSDAIRQLKLAAAMKGKAGTKADHQAVSEQLRSLQSEKRYREGYNAERDGNFKTARKDYQAAIQIQPHSMATASLKRISRIESRNLLINKGNEALQRRDYEIAIKQYLDAIALGASGTVVDGPLFKARLGLKLHEARQFIEQEKIPEARRAYEHILRIKPDHAMATKAITELARREQYLKLVKEAQQLAAQSRHSDAKVHYLRARQILPTPQITRLIEEAEFHDLIDKVHGAIDERAWDRAQALLRTAGDTPAGRRKVDQVSALRQKIHDQLLEVKK